MLWKLLDESYTLQQSSPAYGFGVLVILIGKGLNEMIRATEISSLEQYSHALADYLVEEWGVKDDLGIPANERDNLAMFIQISYETGESVNNAAGDLLSYIRNELHD